MWSRLEAQICIWLTFHTHCSMLYARKEGQSSLDAVGRHLTDHDLHGIVVESWLRYKRL